MLRRLVAAMASKTDGIPATTSPAGASTQLHCVQCGKPVSAQQYILHEGQPYCVACYEAMFAHVCIACAQLIAADSKVEWRSG